MVTLQQTRVLKIFQFDRLGLDFKQVTKVSLEGPSTNVMSSDAFGTQAEELPIFDGGLAVYKDTFVVQYRDSAEFIKIEYKGTPFESVTKMRLWDFSQQNQKPSFKQVQKRADDFDEVDEEEKSEKEGTTTGMTEAALVSAA